MIPSPIHTLPWNHCKKLESFALGRKRRPRRRLLLLRAMAGDCNLNKSRGHPKSNLFCTTGVPLSDRVRAEFFVPVK